MWHYLVSGALKMRLLFWAIQHFLPNEADVKQCFRLVSLGVIALVAGGLLAACTITMVFAAAGLALYLSGSASLASSVLIVIAMMAALVLILLLMGRASLRRAIKALRPSSGNRPLMGSRAEGSDTLQELVNGFLDGIMTGKPRTEDPATDTYPMEDPLRPNIAR